MLFSLSSPVLLLLIFVLIIESSTGNSCKGQVDQIDTCKAVVQFPGDCDAATVNLTDTDYAKCNSANFFWSYPVHNLTLIIQTPFTAQKQPYTTYFDNEQIVSGISHVYRIFNNQETDVTTKDKTLIQYSDANYQVVLKFQGPDHLQRYGVNINYDAVSM
ncbi:unnamed protein product [Rotaria socialis]|uniref:Uncharacterized protein n=1 Tax=Rotaria socialis TaxID=392032 RepID=A0A818CIR4_9BILA|nr:unnamed protein product [Rotaria socialis]CAF4563736.1 unnamed protein product [Rotaria socialis]